MESTIEGEDDLIEDLVYATQAEDVRFVKLINICLFNFLNPKSCRVNPLKNSLAFILLLLG